jgi:hypothetical protein
VLGRAGDASTAPGEARPISSKPDELVAGKAAGPAPRDMAVAKGVGQPSPDVKLAASKPVDSGAPDILLDLLPRSTRDVAA